jgi:hypothetical protein
MLAPKLAIGDGAMGFWAALEDVYPETRQQRCWQTGSAMKSVYLFWPMRVSDIVTH